MGVRVRTRLKGLEVWAMKPGMKLCQTWETQLSLGAQDRGVGAGRC